MANKYDNIIRRIGAEFDGDATQRTRLSDERLDEYEVGLSYSLPSDYREFLRDYGGIGVPSAIYPIKDNRKNEETVFMFFDLWDIERRNKHREQGADFEIEHVPTMRTVLEIGEEVTEIHDPPPELLPIAIDQGGNQVYLALAGLQPGAIFLWMNWADIYFVAESFDAFMQSLQPRTK